MPTPTGLPKVGERVVVYGFDRDKWTWTASPRRGTVTERGRGELWSLRVRWDDDGTKALIVEASYYWQIGAIKLLQQET